MTLLPARTKWMLLTGIVCLLAAGTASAQSNPATCDHDTQCTATPDCGGDICDWSQLTHVCKPAGVGAKGADGWCNVDADCKCMGMGATCVYPYCTFTRACDAPGAAGCASTGTGGSTGAGGSGSGGSTGSAGSGGGGGGGCSISGDVPAAGSALLAMFGLIALSRRRRR
jgi:uncharacterized protein (TIGR03382 family)